MVRAVFFGGFHHIKNVLENNGNDNGNGIIARWGPRAQPPPTLLVLLLLLVPVVK